MNSRKLNLRIVLLLFLIFAVCGIAVFGTESGNIKLSIEQLTSGQKHHFFGYIGQCRTIPWNADGRYVLGLEIDRIDRLPKPEEFATVILVDTENDNTIIRLDKCHAWNPQQGTMFYWNPAKPKTQFFFNDRDIKTGKVFTVLYDIEKKERVREYKYDDTPVGNGGVAADGSGFLAINYGRLARLRLVTGYPEALDWSKDEIAPANDGIFFVNIKTGKKRLLVSYRQLEKELKKRNPELDHTGLFINHTLWNRDSDRVYFFVRGGWSKTMKNKGDRVNTPCSIKIDGTGLTLHKKFIGGHPEWDENNILIGRDGNKQALYDVEKQKIVGQLGTPKMFPNPEGDISLSSDGNWFVNGYKKDNKNYYAVYRRSDGAFVRSEGIDKGKYSGDIRIDGAPRWNRTNDAILIPGIAENGTRQMFVLNVITEEKSANASATQRVYLSGKGPSDAIEWDFHCSSGRRSGEWTNIPVPSNWEQHGFGDYNYGHDKPEDKYAEVGTYRVRFFAPQEWQQKLVRLVFEGSMTETSVKVNGKGVGPVHQGGYHPFHINLKTLKMDSLKYGQQNELEITVAKKPSNDSLDIAERKADFWVFGGIYRPVFLEVSSQTMIHRVAINAHADGQFEMDVFPHAHGKKGTVPLDRVLAQIETLDGNLVGSSMTAKLSASGTTRITLNTKVNNPDTWSPEFPNLYQVRTKLMFRDEVVHEKTERFGFRTFQVRENDGLYLNGKKIRIRGVNRNNFRPETARALDPQDDWQDARDIKSMNANLVRSHMPPTKTFMEACDELGLMSILEQVNWQAPPTDPPVARNIVYSMITYYHNHPSLIIWANGNEGGFVPELDDLFALIDKQGRHVIRPWGKFDGIDAGHYPSFEALKSRLAAGNVVLPTEFLHGLYSGGQGAGLQDYWNEIMNSPVGAGGVLWCWADAAIKRTDLDGKLDTAGNYSADGIVGPHSQKEGSFYTIKQIWSPVQIGIDQIPQNFDGRIEVKNNYDFTNLEQCVFKWKLVEYAKPDDEKLSQAIDRGIVEKISVAPGQTGTLSLKLPDNWKNADSLNLNAIDPHDRDLWTWTLAITKPEDIYASLPSTDSFKQFKAIQLDETIVVSTGDIKYTFGINDATLLAVQNKDISFSFNNGPRVVPASENDSPSGSSVTHHIKDDTYIIESIRNNGLDQFTWTVYSNGMLQLNYNYSKTGQFDYLGITFDYPQEKIISKRWLGAGPYRVWKNRLKGTGLGVWDVDYNDSGPGVSWIYPEFKGYFADMYWVKFITIEGQITVYTETDDLFLRVFTPKAGKEPRNTSPSFPDGDISFLHGINGIGTKFRKAEQLGPHGKKNKVDGTFSGKLRFIFN